MNTSLKLTGRRISNVSPSTNHVVLCNNNARETQSFTLADDELISLAVYKDSKLLGYVGRNGIVQDYNKAELINGRYNPCILTDATDVYFKPIETFYLNQRGVSRNRMFN